MLSFRNLCTTYTGVMLFNTCYAAPNNLGFFKSLLAASCTATFVYLAITPLQIYCEYLSIISRNDPDEMREKRKELREIENTFLREICIYLWDYAYGVVHCPDRYVRELPTFAELDRERERIRRDHDRVRERMKDDYDRREREREYRYGRY